MQLRQCMKIRKLYKNMKAMPQNKTNKRSIFAKNNSRGQDICIIPQARVLKLKSEKVQCQPKGHQANPN